MVPGFAIEIKVIFKPQEYKYYNDAIRIFSEVNLKFLCFFFILDNLNGHLLNLHVKYSTYQLF